MYRIFLVLLPVLVIVGVLYKFVYKSPSRFNSSQSPTVATSSATTPSGSHRDFTALKTFTAQKFNYSFEYPDSVTMEEFESGVSIKGLQGESESVGMVEYFSGDVYVFKQGSTTDTEPIYPNVPFSEFAARVMLPGCSADGANQFIRCDKVLTQESFTSDSGVQGYKLTLNMIKGTFQDGKEVVQSQGAFGPVYVFDISSKNNLGFRALTVRPDLSTSTTDADKEIITTIAKSLKL